MDGGLNNVLTIDRIPRHLLVLCQNRDLAKTLEATLQREDYQATIVQNPRQAALSVLNQKDIDAMICDAQIKLGDEEETEFHQMRESMEAFSIPLMMMLDPNDEGQWRLADKMATDEFVLKPTQSDELLLRLKGLLWRKEIGSTRLKDHELSDWLRGFIRHVKMDLESRFDAGGSATIALIEASGAWGWMVAGDCRGDQLTDQLFDYLAVNLRRVDRVVRYGQVTLMAYMPGRNAALALDALALHQAEFSSQAGRNLCIGLATYPDDGASFTELVLSADRALTRVRVTDANAPDQQPGETHGSQSEAYTILIADDDPFLVALLQATFKALGYKSIVADNGRAAIELIHREHPHLVILDNMMPELSGFELLEQLRSYYRGYLPVPVIMLTIMNSQEDIIRGYELGVEDYIGKPFNPRELIARVERVLAQQSLSMCSTS